MRNRLGDPKSAGQVTGVLLLGLLAVVACSPGRGVPAGYTARDSAGVRIVDNARQEWGDGEGWALAREPMLSIGTADGDDRYLFSRITAGRMMPDGGFVVMDRGSLTLRRYSATGAFMWEAGRAGDGPGEFRNPTVLQVVRPDSLLVFDAYSRQLAIFDPDGGLARSLSLQVPGVLPPYVVAVATTADGGMVAITSGSSPNTPEEGLSVGIRRPRAFFLLCDAAGAFVDTVAVLPGTEASITNVGFGLRVSLAPYGHITSYALRGTDVVVGNGDHVQVEVRSTAGEVLSIIRAPDPDLALTETDVQAYRDWFVGRLPEQQREMAGPILDATIYPENKAASTHVHADPDGNVWLEAGGPDYEIPPFRTVFSREGRLLGSVAFPGSFRVLDFASSAVLGVWTDGFDVQHVRVYSIRR